MKVNCLYITNRHTDHIELIRTDLAAVEIGWEKKLKKALTTASYEKAVL